MKKNFLWFVSSLVMASVVAPTIAVSISNNNLKTHGIEAKINNDLIFNRNKNVRVSQTTIKQPTNKISTLSSQVAQDVKESNRFDNFLQDFIATNCFDNKPAGFSASNIIEIEKTGFDNIRGILTISSIKVNKYIDNNGDTIDQDKIFDQLLLSIEGFNKVNPTTISSDLINTNIVITDISSLSSNDSLKRNIEGKLLSWVRSNFNILLKNVPRNFTPQNITEVSLVISSENEKENTARFNIKINNYYANDGKGTQYTNNYAIGSGQFKFLLTSPESNNNESIPLWVWIAAGSGALLLIILIIVISIIIKKKKASKKKKNISSIKKPVPNNNKLAAPSPSLGSKQNVPNVNSSGGPLKPGQPAGRPSGLEQPTGPQKPGMQNSGMSKPTAPPPPPPIKINNNTGSFAPKIIKK